MVEMFEVGELVVYGNKGVFKVEAIGVLDGMFQSGKEYYTLRSVRSSSQMVYIPVQSEKSPLRKVITKEQSLDLLERLPGLGQLEIKNEKLREQTYRESMDKHECEEWMKVLKTLYNRMQERRLRGKRATSMDERYMQVAKKCLLEEFAVAMSISTDEVEQVIKKKIHE